MSLRFLDPNRIPSVPKSYRYSHNGHEFRIPWNTNIPWHSFYSTVRSFQERNNHPVSSVEQVEDMICSQLPKGWCTGDATYRAPAPRPRGCSACGRRG